MTKECAICGEIFSEEQLAGDICLDCADRYDTYGVYFILGWEGERT